LKARRPSSQKQYIELLKTKKMAALTSLRQRSEPLFLLDFTLLVELIVTGESGEGILPLRPVPVWRRIVVSGGLNLQQLHDRVLCPAMGWVRNYHGFVYLFLIVLHKLSIY